MLTNPASLSGQAELRHQFRVFPRRRRPVDAAGLGQLLGRLRRRGRCGCGCGCSMPTARCWRPGSRRCRPAPAASAIDSREVRARFGLPPFTGQLVHPRHRRRRPRRGEIRAGHLCVRQRRLACPARMTPTPGRPTASPACRRRAPDETVVLWLQNSHAVPIPAGAIALDRMGAEQPVALDRAVGPFATVALDVGATAARTCAGRRRSNCAPAGTSCGRATR